VAQDQCIAQGCPPQRCGFYNEKHHGQPAMAVCGSRGESWEPIAIIMPAATRLLERDMREREPNPSSTPLSGRSTDTVKTHRDIDKQVVHTERAWFPTSETMTIIAVPNGLG
jgi:hypothetical protein